MLFAGAMVRTVNYDEDQYVAAAVMTASAVPYRDFAYLQPPLYPLVLAPVLAVSGGYNLLAARLVTFGLSVLSGGLLWAIVRRLGASRGLGVVLLAACLGSPFLLQPLSNTRNDVLPLVLMLAGLWVQLRAETVWSQSGWGRAGAALLFGLAVEAKLTYLFGPLALGVHALFDVRRRMWPVLLGTALAAVPALVFLLLAPDAFRFGLLDYHLVAPLDWYTRQAQGVALLPLTRLGQLGGWLVLGGNLTLLVLAGALSMLVVGRRRKWKKPGRLLVGLTVGALLFAFIPSPAWPMYFAPVAPLLACCVAHLDRVTAYLAGPRFKCILFGVAVIPLAPALLFLGSDVTALDDPEAWVGLVAHRTAVAMRAALPQGGEVATLFPHLVIDANPVPRAFATGAFVFRSGDAFSPERLKEVHALSPGMLEAAFAAHPPAGIHAGAYAGVWRTPMDAALAAYAERHGWRLAWSDPKLGGLWVPPARNPP